MVQTIKRAVAYCRVSTEDQNCDRQERDLREFAERAGYYLVAVYKETASGAKNDRKKRAEVMQLARTRQIDTVLVTELSRWGRSTADLLNSLQELYAYKVSIVAQTGLQFDLSTPTGKLMATLMSGLAEFERDLLRERVKSGMQSAKARGKHIGRPAIKTSEKHAGKVMQAVAAGESVRDIAKHLGISPTTVQAIKSRHQKTG